MFGKILAIKDLFTGKLECKDSFIVDYKKFFVYKKICMLEFEELSDFYSVEKLKKFTKIYDIK